MEERELVRRAMDGDVFAYGKLVKRHQKAAFGVAYLITRNTQAAEDAIQEAFLNAYRAMEKFRSETPFKPWLLRIVRNEALKQIRSSGRVRKLEYKVYEENVTDLNGREPSPESELLTWERGDELLDAVKELREEDRLVIACRYFFDLSEKETAEAMGCPKGTVKSRLARSLARLRRMLSGSALEAKIGRGEKKGERSG
ncbi:MAG: RNA polymerase sigma factor [Rubrobacteraceae bacterium]